MEIARNLAIDEGRSRVVEDNSRARKRGIRSLDGGTKKFEISIDFAVFEQHLRAVAKHYVEAIDDFASD